MTSLLLIVLIFSLFAFVLAFETVSDSTQPRPKVTGLMTWLVSGNWPAKVGAGLVIIGIGALLRYAFANIDIPPELKLGSGAVLTAVLGFVAMMLKGKPTRRAVYFAVAGAAFGVAYLTAYSAYGFFNYINDVNALALLALTAIAAGFFAVTSNAMSVAILAMVGAYIAPKFALGTPGVFAVYGYYLAASSLSLVMVTLRGWRPLIHLSFLFTLAGALFFGWSSGFYEPEYYAAMQPLLLALTIVHLLMPILERKHVRSIGRARFDTAYFVALPLVAASLTLKIAPDFHFEGAIGLGALGATWGIASVVLYALKRDEFTIHGVVAALLVIAAVLCIPQDLPWVMVGLGLSVLTIVVSEKLECPSSTPEMATGAATLFGVLHIIQSITQPPPTQAFLNEVFAYRLTACALMVIGGQIGKSKATGFSKTLSLMGGIWAALALLAEVIRMHLVIWPQLVYSMTLAMAFASLVVGGKKAPHPAFNGLLIFALTAFGWIAVQDASNLVVFAYLALTLAAMVGMAWSGRDSIRKENSDFSPSIAIGLLPFALLPWAISIADICSIKTDFFEASVAMVGAGVAGLSARSWLRNSTRWNDRIQPLHVYIVAFCLIAVTLFHIERSIWAVTFELLALCYLVAYVTRRHGEQSGTGFGVGIMMVSSIALVIQAMLLRAFGPENVILDASDINKMQLPAVASLMWVCFGAGLAWWGTRCKSRPLWSAGSMLLAAAAVKLAFFDFGALGQLGNILAFIAAGVVFLGVAWFAPIPKKSELVSKFVPKASGDLKILEGVEQATPTASVQSAVAKIESPVATNENDKQVRFSSSAVAASQRRREPKGINGLWFLYLALGIFIAIFSSAWHKYSRLHKQWEERQQISEMQRKAAQPSPELVAEAIQIPSVATVPVAPADELTNSNLGNQGEQKDSYVIPTTSSLPARDDNQVITQHVTSNGIPSPDDSASSIRDLLYLSRNLPRRDLADGAEIVLISGYEPSGKNNSGTIVNVEVDRPGAKVLLVLTSYEKISWQVSASASTKISGVLVSGYYPSTVMTKVKTQGYELKLPYAYETENSNFRELMARLNSLFGIEKLDVFRGSYSIPPMVRVSGIDPPRVELTVNGPTPKRTSTNFTFSLLSTDNTKVLWSLSGPVAKNEKGYVGEGKIAISKSGNTIYRVVNDQLEITELSSGRRYSVFLPPNFPRFSWVMDIAYDTRRDIVSVVTLGGEGFFYRFDAAQQRWLDYRSLNNVDISSLSYDQKMDRYVAWADNGNLMFLSSEGGSIFTRKLGSRVEGLGRLYDRGNSRAPRLTIAPSGDDVALLHISEAEVKRIWYYDVRTDKVELTY